MKKLKINSIPAKLFSNSFTLKKGSAVKGKPSPKQKPPSTDVTSMCVSCDKTYVMIPSTGVCTRCGGEIHKFDSNMEYLRYVYLRDAPYISHLRIQRPFELALPEAIYSVSPITGQGEPQLIGYKKKPKAYSEYKIDFVYYDSTTLMGWVAEEFKPCPEKMDQETKKKFICAFDQHNAWGHFCYSYPCQTTEIVNGREHLRGYKRHFAKRYGGSDKVRYPDYNRFFKNPLKSS